MNEIYKEAENLDIPVSNAKDIIDHFFSLDKKYCRGQLAFMVGTDSGKNEVFRQVENIQIYRYTPSITCIFWTTRHWKCWKLSHSKPFGSIRYKNISQQFTLSKKCIW